MVQQTIGVELILNGELRLLRLFKALPDRMRKKAISGPVREEAKKARLRIVGKITSEHLVVTGTYREAWRRTPVKKSSRTRAIVRLGPIWPHRDTLDVMKGDKWYYPAAIEYGHTGKSGTVKPYPHARPAIDDTIDTNRRRLINDIRNGIEKQWSLMVGGAGNATK